MGLFGIPGLDPFGLAHAALGFAALALGLVVIARSKGSAAHRLWGVAYAVAMVLLNGSALAMYEVTGGPNMLHGFAVISLATLVAGWVPALTRRPAGRWYARHAVYMAWSYVGLVAAFTAEVAVRLPFGGPGRIFVVAGMSGLVAAVLGTVLIRRLMPEAVARAGDAA